MWFPMWSLTRPDAPSDEPVLVVDERVTGATRDVLDAGVTLGMPRREAEALAPFATVMIRDVGEETRRFEPVVALVEGLVPRVEVVGPGLIYVPLAGAVSYYGGEEALARKIDEALQNHFATSAGGPKDITSEASAGGSRGVARSTSEASAGGSRGVAPPHLMAPP